jgi:hypothetical protein
VFKKLRFDQLLDHMCRQGFARTVPGIVYPIFFVAFCWTKSTRTMLVSLKLIPARVRLRRAVQGLLRRSFFQSFFWTKSTHG